MQVLFLFLMVSFWVLSGQESPAAPKIGELVTDRPDYTESVEIVAKGWVQLETGFQLDRSGETRGYTFGAPLLRVGITKKFELRLATDGVVGQRDAPDPIHRGMADASIGFKYKFLDETEWGPSLAVLPVLSVPTGNPAFTSAAADPGIKVALAKDVPLGFSVSSNISYHSLSDGEGRYDQGAITLSVGHGFGERVAGFWELYSFDCDGRDSGRMTVVQTGLTVAVGQNSQFDVSVGRRVTAVGPDWLVSFGWATRHPFSFATWFRR